MGGEYHWGWDVTPSSLPLLPPSLPLTLTLPSFSFLPPSPSPPSLPPFHPFLFFFSFLLLYLSPIPYIQGDLSQPGMILEGQDDRDRFGNSVTNLGDIDNDGYEGMHVCGM